MGDHLRRYRDRLADTASGRLGAIQRGASRLATSVAPESDALHAAMGRLAARTVRGDA